MVQNAHGLHERTQYFSEMVEKLLSTLIGSGVEVYLDDIAMHAKTREKHDGLLRKVYEILEKYNLYINAKKLMLAKEGVKPLGILVSGKTQKL